MIKYGESKIDQIMFGEQMINKVYYGPRLIFNNEDAGDYWITGTTVEPNQEITIFSWYAEYKIITNSDNNSVFKITPEFDVESVTNMNGMFEKCFSLQSLNLENFNTENVTSMYYTFSECSNLQSLNLENFNTEKVTNMGNTFYYCLSLQSLNLESFNTKKVTDMSHMFDNCQNLRTLDLSSFNTEKLKNMNYMFSYCSNLTEIKGIENFNPSVSVSMQKAFEKCGIQTLDLSNIRRVSSMYNAFSNCFNLETLYLDNLDIEIEGNTDFYFLYQMFYNCSSLKYIRCKQAFKDWCIENANQNYLSDTKMLTDEGVWDIID